jgi:aspartate aminotransferase
MLCQSFAKSFGLYGQRVGCLTTLCATQKEASDVQSQMKIIARRTYSSPPLHGARIVGTILNDESLFKLWSDDILLMSTRISDMRVALVENLKRLGSPHNWDHITNQIGMFAYTGLNKEQVQQVTEKYHIYLAADGRISISGLNTKNVAYVAEAFNEITKNA